MQLSASPRDRLAVLCAFEPGTDFLGLPGPQACRDNFRCLVFLDRELAGDLARVHGQSCQNRAIRAPASNRVGHGGAWQGVAAERIEKIALRPLVQETLLVVLAMDLDQWPGNIGKARCGHGLIVHARRGAAGR